MSEAIVLLKHITISFILLSPHSEFSLESYYSLVERGLLLFETRGRLEDGQ
jgi:hypothetical protein